MKYVLLSLAVSASAAVSQAQAAGVDVVDTWSLNTPTLDCFRSFDEYYHQKTGWTYYGAHINCVTIKAFIQYDRRFHDSEMT